MNRRDAIMLVTWVNQVDARVLLNEPSTELWASALAPVTAAEAKQAVLDHYERNESAVTPAGTRKRALSIRETNAARQQAVEVQARAAEASDGWAHKSIKQRIRNTPEFQALFEEGRRQGNAERARNMEARNAA